MKIGVCARVKDEQKIIIDWINHYTKLGFDKIFIYDNCSSPSVKEQLKKKGILNKKIFIEIDKVNKSNQPVVYQDCINKNKDLDWILLIDADEFLDIRVNKTIKEFLSSFEENVATILINWVCYGTSNKQKFDFSKHIFEQFTIREEYNSWWNSFVKSFIRPKLIKESSVHITYNRDYKIKNVYNSIVNPTGKCFLKDLNLKNNTPIVLIHYLTLDLQSMLEKGNKNKKGYLLRPYDKKYTIEWYKKNFKNNVDDKQMLKYIKWKFT